LSPFLFTRIINGKVVGDGGEGIAPETEGHNFVPLLPLLEHLQAFDQYFYRHRRQGFDFF